MNMFKTFERRVGDVFGASPRGQVAPFSFRKLAKRAARELEAETYVIDGINTAPALITVLVAAEDDQVMRPMYAQLAEELSALVEAEAASKDYVFVGKPLSRFMVDQSLRPGRFAVFANNVDARSLEQLRAEERAFLAGEDVMGGAASPAPAPVLQPIPYHEELTDLDHPNGVSVDLDDSAAGLSVLPPEYDDELSVADSLVVGVAAVPEVAAESAAGAAAAQDDVDLDALLGLDVAPNAQAGSGERASHMAADAPEPEATPEPDVPEEPAREPGVPTCRLVDRESGRTYTATAPGAVIGRDRESDGIVLRDPNVSRRHAQLLYDSGSWQIRDLGSTNGTLVNDVDVDTAILHDGDLLTFGLLVLEFRSDLS